MSDRPDLEPDYYAVLGLTPDATPAEIELSYRRLASERLNAVWRPRRAARELTQINAAYAVLRYPERRAEYDQRRAQAAEREARGEVMPAPLAEDMPAAPYRQRSQAYLPRVQVGRPSPSASTADSVMIVMVVVLSLFVGALFITRSPVDLSILETASETLGLTARRRAVPPVASPSPIPVLPAAQPSPAAGTPTPSPPLGALPPSVAKERFSGSRVQVSDPSPAQGTNITVTLTLLREGRPVPDANVFLEAHFRTVDERHPAGNATVKTNANGQAMITFNIGNATRGHPVNLDVTALVEGQQVVFQTSFTPR